MIQWGDRRVGDHVLLTTPQIWRCHYPECSFVASTVSPLRLSRAVADHLLFHYQREVEARTP